MSAQTFMDAFAPAEHFYKMQVMEATWGHLAPKKNTSYKGHIVWALDLYDSGYLNPKVLECELGDLPDSPWFFNAMIDFLSDIHEKMFSADRKSFWGPSERETRTAGTIWRWDGTFHNYEWFGKVRQLHCDGLQDHKRTSIRRASAKLTKQDFERIAANIRKIKTCVARQKAAKEIIPELRTSNPKFDEHRFLVACNA